MNGILQLIEEKNRIFYFNWFLIIFIRCCRQLLPRLTISQKGRHLNFLLENLTILYPWYTKFKRRKKFEFFIFFIIHDFRSLLYSTFTKIYYVVKKYKYEYFCIRKFWQLYMNGIPILKEEKIWIFYFTSFFMIFHKLLYKHLTRIIILYKKYPFQYFSTGNIWKLYVNNILISIEETNWNFLIDSSWFL